MYIHCRVVVVEGIRQPAKKKKKKTKSAHLLAELFKGALSGI